MVRLGHQIDDDLLDCFPDLDVLASATTGTNHIDLEACDLRNVKVLTLRGETKFLDQISSTAEHAFGLILALAKNTPFAFETVKNRGFGRDDQIGSDLSGKVLGIVGFGRLGKKVANYAQSFGMTVVVSDVKTLTGLKGQGVKQVDFEELVSMSDVISLHASHQAGEPSILDARAFERMKPGVMIVNTARGELVNEADLMVALESQTLSAALDVVNQETHRPQPDPLVEYAKRNSNLILTPHIGGATKESLEKAELFVANKMIRFL